MDTVPEPEEEAPATASITKFVFFANGVVALAILSFLSSESAIGNTWLLVALVLSAVGALSSFLHWLAIPSSPAMIANAGESIESLKKHLGPLNDALDSLRATLDATHKSDREHIAWYEEKIVMLAHALREGELSMETSSEVTSLLDECKTNLESHQVESSELLIEIARYVDGLKQRKGEIAGVIESLELRRGTFEKLFYHSASIGRLFFVLAVVVGLFGVASGHSG